MKTKLMPRYYCDHCGKGGCAKGHMRHHEERCTMNPSRVCGMCEYVVLNEGGSPLVAAVAFLNVHKIPDSLNYLGKSEAQKLRDICNDCPACILAATRQADAIGIIEGFDYQKESRLILDDRLEELNGSYS